MRRLFPILLVLTGCTAADLDATDDTIGGKADSAVAALEGTREGYAVLRMLNDQEGSTFEFLDDTVALDRRAAANLVEHRDGLDGEPFTEDDDLFDSIEEVDDVPWVGPAALETLSEFARLNDYLPGDDELLGRYDGVDFTYAEAERVLGYVNTAAEQDMADASVPSRAIDSIVDARPIATVAELAELYWVGPRTLEHLLEAVAVPEGDVLCQERGDCATGFRCTGRPHGFDYGICQDMTQREGIQDDCEVDADCNEGLVCIAQSVYSRGYCARAWMRDDFTDEGWSSIPSVAMSEPMAFGIWVYGQATVPEDVWIDIDLEHTDPSSLWIGLQPPTGQEPVTLYDGATAEGPIPERIVDRGVYRDDSVNGRWFLLVQNVEGRGEGVLRGFTLHVSSRWD